MSSVYRFYPQLREVQLPPKPDLDESNLAKLEAIEDASEKEYLNAILSILPHRFREIERYLFIVVIELAIIGLLIAYRVFF